MCGDVVVAPTGFEAYVLPSPPPAGCVVWAQFLATPSGGGGVSVGGPEGIATFAGSPAPVHFPTAPSNTMYVWDGAGTWVAISGPAAP